MTFIVVFLVAFFTKTSPRNSDLHLTSFSLCFVVYWSNVLFLKFLQSIISKTIPNILNEMKIVQKLLSPNYNAAIKFLFLSSLQSSGDTNRSFETLRRNTSTSFRENIDITKAVIIFCSRSLVCEARTK